MEEIKGYVTNIIYRNEQNLYTVFELETPDGTTSVTGYPASLSVGDALVMTGEFRTHAIYGDQFVMDTMRECPPEGAVAIQHYLGSGAIKGIGEALAARIVKRFGDETLKVCEEQPERLAEVKGISDNKAREIAAQMSEKKDLRDAILFLQKYGISNRFAVKIWQQYGMQMYSVMKENPYRLADDIQGIGFARADEIAAKAGIRADSDHRIRSGILYVLSEAMGDGSSYLPENELIKRAMALLDLPVESIQIQIGNLAMERKVRVLDHDGEKQVYSGRNYSEEQQIAGMLHDLDSETPRGAWTMAETDARIRDLEEREKIELDDLQKKAVKLAADNSVLLITGGPGTGKTTTINTIIRFFIAEDQNVLLCAPTGRAAKRMTEATGYESRTIHRLLGVHAMNTGSDDPTAVKDSDSGNIEFTRAVFEKGKDDQLDADVIIVDEMSMVDMHIFKALLLAIEPGTRLIMVGDVNQLPSVGPGKVLQDLLKSYAFHSIVLEKIFRQASESDIVMNAHYINDGKQIKLDNKSRDFFFLERDNVQVIYKHIVQLIRDKLPRYVGCSTQDIQVLTPMRKGLLGVTKLNEILQITLNPRDPGKKEYSSGDTTFRVGDKVMQIRNNYQIEWEVRGKYGIPVDKGQGVFNGDFGMVTAIDKAAEKLTVCFDEDRSVDYPFSSLGELELAYAVTVHKSQGSEYPAVIIPILSGPPALFNSNLLYTAVTRAKMCVVILGSRDAVMTMIDNTSQNKRYTGLEDRIREITDQSVESI